MKWNKKPTKQYKRNLKEQVKERDGNRCVVCGRPFESIHHVYKGRKNKDISDNNVEFMVCLCYNCHQGTNGVHGKNGHKLDERLKWEAQQRYEANGHTREEFISLIGRSYEP